jgi:hypothetical protein
MTSLFYCVDHIFKDWNTIFEPKTNTLRKINLFQKNQSTLKMIHKTVFFVRKSPYHYFFIRNIA